MLLFGIIATLIAILSLGALVHVERERRRALAQLATLRDALDAAQVGTFEFDLLRDRLQLSPVARAAFGLPPGAAEPGIEDLVARVHHDDRGRVQATIAGWKERAEARAVEYRVLRPDGGIAYLSSRFATHEHMGSTLPRPLSG